MITALLSSKEIKSDILNSVISKKLESVNNLQIALDKEGGIVVYPLDYPSSINAMMRALSIADKVLVVINEEITAVDAEIALAVENSSIETGVALRLEYSDEGSFSKFFEKYKVGKFKILSPGEAPSGDGIKAKSPDFSYVSIDKHFIVKGIGSVIIGFNLGGSIKKGERLHLLPSMKDISIKSIQLMDVDSQSADNG
jgi:selenocysteine-specific translation elongation factor